MAVAIACSTIVLPAFGGATMSPRWPLPIGASRSMIRAVADGSPSSSRSLSSGYSGVRSSKCGRGRPGGLPLTVTTASSGLNLPRAVPLGWDRAVPSIRSPFLSPYWRICAAET